MSNTVQSTTRRPGRALGAAELRTWLGSPTPPRVLDVRTPAEFEAAHIPGFYNVPLDTLREHRDELARSLDDDVVLVCRSGMRAAQAERAFGEAGLPGLHVLDGGVLRWEADGGALNRGRRRWDLERQVRLAAGGLVLAGGVGSLAVPRLKWLSTAVGGGLVVAALTNTCAMGAALAKLPFNRSADTCDVGAVVAELSLPRS